MVVHSGGGPPAAAGAEHRRLWGRRQPGPPRHRYHAPRAVHSPLVHSANRCHTASLFCGKPPVQYTQGREQGRIITLTAYVAELRSKPRMYCRVEHMYKIGELNW